MRALQGALYRVLLAATLWALLAAAAKPQTKGYKNKEEARTAAAQLQALASAERRQLFNDWKAEYGKNFGANGSQLDNLKFSKWSARLDAVIEHNKAAVYSFKGLNRFSELSFREFSSKWLMTPKDPAELAGRVPVPGGGSRRLLADPPAALDWRTQGVDLPIRDQGGCGACWAFAAIAAVEAKALILGTATDISTLDLSEQQLVDCAKSGTLDYWSLGCESGYSDDALWYLSDYYGTTEARYPFQGVQGPCRHKPANATVAPAWGDMKLMPTRGVAGIAADPASIMSAVATYGPVVHYFSVQDSFYGYSSGIYQASECVPGWYNHAMVIVGYNATKGVGSNESYWIVRNQWGDWGEAGHIRVQMTQAGACSMYSGLMRPLNTQNMVAAPASSPPSPPTPPPSPPPPPPPPPSPPKRPPPSPPPSPLPPSPRPPSPSPPPPSPAPSPKPPSPNPPPPRPPPPPSPRPPPPKTVLSTCGAKGQKKCSPPPPSPKPSPPRPPLGGLTRSPPPPRPRPQIEAVMRDAALWRGFTGVWDTLSSPSLTADTRLLTSGLNTQLAVHFRAGLADPKRRYVRAALFASTAVDRATAALLPPNATAGTGWKLKVTVNGRVLKPADAAPMGGGEVVRTFPAAKGRSARMAILTPKMRISMNVASKTSAADQQRFGKWLNVRVTVFRTQILPKPVLGLFGPSYIAARG